ncbi:diaminopimelate epimerase [Bizionia sp. KMM 8389]
MTCTFYKYQGTGNDFVMIDNRQQIFNKKNTKLIKRLCDRRFGIGADGLILLENHESLDFRMVYYNADGNESTMCGNGGRCLVAFANFLGIVDTSAEFMAVDGKHRAIITPDYIKLEMQEVSELEILDTHTFLNTGSPHHVQIETNLKTMDVKGLGTKIRYGSPYNQAGTNVNFVTKNSDSNFSVRTYERGVEDETLSCGTGVTAVAIAMYATGKTDKNLIALQTEGGELQVSFDVNADTYTNIWLIGPAKQVFKGEVLC